MGTSGLGNLLVEEGLLTESDRRTIKRESGTYGSAFAKSVVALGLLDEDELAAFLAERTPHKIAPKDLVTDDKSVGAIDRPIMERLGVVPLSAKNDVLKVAMADPLDHDSLAQLRFFTGRKIQPVIATFSQIQGALQRLFPDYQPPQSGLEEFLRNHLPAAAISHRVSTPATASDEPTAEPIVSHVSPKPRVESPAVSTRAKKENVHGIDSYGSFAESALGDEPSADDEPVAELDSASDGSLLSPDDMGGDLLDGTSDSLSDDLSADLSDDLEPLDGAGALNEGALDDGGSWEEATTDTADGTNDLDADLSVEFGREGSEETKNEPDLGLTDVSETSTDQTFPDIGDDLGGSADAAPAEGSDESLSDMTSASEIDDLFGGESTESSDPIEMDAPMRAAASANESAGLDDLVTDPLDDLASSREELDKALAMDDTNVFSRSVGAHAEELSTESEFMPETESERVESKVASVSASDDTEDSELLAELSEEFPSDGQDLADQILADFTGSGEGPAHPQKEETGPVASVSEPLPETDVAARIRATTGLNRALIGLALTRDHKGVLSQVAEALHGCDIAPAVLLVFDGKEAKTILQWAYTGKASAKFEHDPSLVTEGLSEAFGRLKLGWAKCSDALRDENARPFVTLGGDPETWYAARIRDNLVFLGSWRHGDWVSQKMGDMVIDLLKQAAKSVV